jgi:hypothetical protein
MKFNKIFAVVALLAMTTVAFAANTALAVINISSESGNGNDVLTLLEGTTYSNAYESGADAIKLMNDGSAYSINLYAEVGGQNLAIVATNDLSGTALTFKSNTTETSYTMTFSSVMGTVKLYDAVTGTETVMANSGTYNFTCPANQTIAGRFVINYTPSAPAICHRYGKLQVSDSNSMTVKVLNMDGSATSIADVVISSYYQEIDLSGLAAGQYKVEWNSQTLIIDVQ